MTLLNISKCRWVSISEAYNVGLWGGLGFPPVVKGITRSVVSVSSSFIRYIYYLNLQFLNNVIIFKTKDSSPSGIVANFCYPVWARGSCCSQTLNYLAFQYFDIEGFSRNRPCATKFDIYVILEYKKGLLYVWGCQMLYISF